MLVLLRVGQSSMMLNVAVQLQGQLLRLTTTSCADTVSDERAMVACL